MSTFDWQDQSQEQKIGALLDALFNSANVVNCEIGVAWARRSGVKQLVPSFGALLSRGGSLSVVVGIDITNTTAEGLQLLLDVQRSAAKGQMTVFVYHEEGQTSTFHPKVFLFERDSGESTVLVGSYNMTAAALNTNVEAGLRFTGQKTDLTIQAAKTALSTWRDVSSDFVKPLTKSVLNDLVENRYVLTEAQLRVRSSAFERLTPQNKRLFGTRKVQRKKGLPPPEDKERAALLMRIRTARGTQAQIPQQLLADPFFGGANELISPDGIRRVISAARARGAVNTRKVEIPESAAMKEPLLVISRTSVGMRYDCIDADTPEGSLIKRALLVGFATNPQTTHNTRPTDIARGTWYRFV